MVEAGRETEAGEEAEVKQSAVDTRVPFWLRLETRLTLALVLVGLIPLTAFAGYMLVNLRDAVRTASEQTLTATARDYGNRVDSWLRKGLQQVDLAARLPDLEPAAVAEPGIGSSDWALLEGLRRFGETEPVYFRSVGVFDTEGRTVRLLPDNWPVGAASGAMWFEMPLQTARPSFHYCRKTCPTGELIFSALMMRGERPNGVLRIGYDPSVLRQLMVEISGKTDPMAFVVLLDEDGRLLASDRRKLPHGWVVGDRLPEGSGHAALAPVAFESVQDLELETAHSGRWTAAVEPLQEVPWQLVYLVPRDQFLLPLRNQLLFSGSIAGGLVLLLVLLGYGSARLLARDLNHLAAAARDLGTGDLRIRVPEMKKDECGVLARSFNDMAARLQARRDALERARYQAEEASRAKSRFLSVMSHEVRTPLNAVIGYSDLLLSEKGLTPTMQQEVTIIRRSGRQLLEMLNNMLDFSKLEAGRVELDRRPFPILGLLSEVVEQTAASAQAKGLDFVVEPVGCVPETVVADGPKLRQILLNLVSNAIKFTRQGGVRIHVETDFGRGEHGNLLIRVEDTGPGISADVRRRLFQPFMQGDSSVSREYGGTGLGLVISREIARVCGGNLTECGPRTMGACFALSVPVSREGESNLPEPGRWPALAGVPVWLFAQNPLHRAFLREQLEKLAMPVVGGPGQAALWILDETTGVDASQWPPPELEEAAGRAGGVLYLYHSLQPPKELSITGCVRHLAKPVLAHEFAEALDELQRAADSKPQNPQL